MNNIQIKNIISDTLTKLLKMNKTNKIKALDNIKIYHYSMNNKDFFFAKEKGIFIKIKILLKNNKIKY